MNKFNFGRPVDICGHVYYIDVAGKPELAEKFRSVSDRLSAANQKLHEATTPDEAMAAGDGITQLVKEAVDIALGAGAFDEIFSERTPDPYSMTQLMRFLTAEMRAERRPAPKPHKRRKK